MQTLLLVLGGIVVGILVGWLQGTPANVRYVRVQPPPVGDARPPAGDSARRSAAFVRELVALADRLAARDIRVHKLACGPSWFWEMVLQPGAEADQGETVTGSRLTRVFWDGKEFSLSVEWAPFVPGAFDRQQPALSRAQLHASPRTHPEVPGPAWNLQLRTKVGRTGDAIGAAEDLLTRHPAGSAATNPGAA
jgi:hypothetical protein